VIWFLLLFGVFGLLAPWIGSAAVRRNRRHWRDYDRATGTRPTDD
jgi:hypothetical protein